MKNGKNKGNLGKANPDTNFDIDTQWFADYDESSPPPKEGPTNLNFETPSEEDFDIIVAENEPPEEDSNIPDEYKGLEKIDLINQVKQTQEQMKQIQEQYNQMQQMQQNFSNVNDQIDAIKQQQQYQQPQQQPQMSEEDFKEKFNEKFADDPYSATNEFFTKKLAPQVQNVLMNNMYYSRQFLENDETRKDTYNQYKSEIEQEVQRMDPKTKATNPQLYQEVHDRVVSRHLNEIVQQKVQEALKESQPDTNNTSQTQGPYSEPGVRRVPPKQKKQISVYLTDAEKKHADNIGMSHKEYAKFKYRNKL
jgi:hypothetical protein